VDLPICDTASIACDTSTERTDARTHSLAIVADLLIHMQVWHDILDCDIHRVVHQTVLRLSATCFGVRAVGELGAMNFAAGACEDGKSSVQVEQASSRRETQYHV